MAVSNDPVVDLLMDTLSKIEHTLKDGFYDDLFACAPEAKERFKASINTASVAVIEAELRAHPESYEQLPTGEWKLRDNVVVPFPLDKH
jgi:hypothetical protein